MPQPGPQHRDTIFPESAEILSHDSFAGNQRLLRLAAPECAAHAQPGNFVHLQCHPLRPLRRPLSLMRVSPREGWIEILYQVVGEGTALLAQREPGEQIPLLGPIGRPFQPHTERPRPLLIGGGIGMPPMIFLAEYLRDNHAFQPLVVLGSEVPFPFQPTRSGRPVAGLPAATAAAMPLLEEWGIPSRLASLREQDGVFPGFVTELARVWLEALTEKERAEVEIFACGPHPMLEAVAALAHTFGLPCQISLEEFMACGVGGCAGCVVPVAEKSGTVMRRVCVDGPVFEAAQIFPM
jgi:dihydroorotate dehydrogenase electron transfer subunit